MPINLTPRVTDLIARRVPFVSATVVRAQCPTSARPGDAAIVLADGSIEGFVGGQCAEGSVRTAALDVLSSGEAVLLRILPDAAEEVPDAPGARTVVNECLSGGAIEVFLEPRLPAPILQVVGTSPIAAALAELAPRLGFVVATDPPAEPPTAVVVATHGRHELETIRGALDAGVGWIGLVASPSRGAAVLDELALTPDERAVVHSPVGLDIGARTAEEIAVSILAGLIRAIRVEGLEAPKADTPARPATAVDPVCGMTVTVGPDTPHARVDGVDVWFCNPGCRTRWLDEVGAS